MILRACLRSKPIAIGVLFILAVPALLEFPVTLIVRLRNHMCQVATGARLVEHDVRLHGGKGDEHGGDDGGGVRHNDYRCAQGEHEQHDIDRLRPGEGERSVHELPAPTRTGDVSIYIEPELFYMELFYLTPNK